MGFWLEVRRAIARWTGVMLASVFCGLLLGLLRRQGIAYRSALEIALPVGFLLALLFWIWVSSRFSTAIAKPAPVSAAAVNFEGQSIAVSFQCAVITETQAVA
jgi:hypothetical protein